MIKCGCDDKYPCGVCTSRQIARLVQTVLGSRTSQDQNNYTTVTVSTLTSSPSAGDRLRQQARIEDAKDELIKLAREVLG